MKHIPVLLDEVLSVFNPQSGGRYIDGTLGDGGHSEALLQKTAPNGRVLGLDQDVQQIAVAKARLEAYGDRFVAVNSRFSNLEETSREQGMVDVDGVLLDLGISSRQLDNPDYGLTFADDAPLDMRLSLERQDSAADFLNRANEQEIADVLYVYGDRHNSRALARRIVQYRKKRAFEVARDLKEALNLWKPGGLAPIFQALRIWVNDEYAEIESVLPQAVSVLKQGGCLAVITFHSGEDRIVKRFLKSHHELLEVPKQIITPSVAEQRANPRSRSAKLRWAYKK